MRRLARWTLNALTAVSLLLCLATVAVWAGSFLVGVVVEYESPEGFGHVALSYGSLSGMFQPTASAWVPDLRIERPSWELLRPWRDGLPNLWGSGWTIQRGHMFTSMAHERRGWRFPIRSAGVPALALLLLWVASRQVARRRMAARTADGACRACGYDLAGNVSGVCPECGTAIVKGKA